MAKAPKPLTPAERRFVDAYVATGNAAEAARQAYPKSKTAATHGHKVLGRPHVVVELARLRAVVEGRNNLSRQAVVDRLWAIGQSDERDRVPALAQLCRVLGYNEPEQVNVTVTGARERLMRRVGEALARAQPAAP